MRCGDHGLGIFSVLFSQSQRLQVLNETLCLGFPLENKTHGTGCPGCSALEPSGLNLLLINGREREGQSSRRREMALSTFCVICQRGSGFGRDTESSIPAPAEARGSPMQAAGPALGAAVLGAEGRGQVSL